MNSNGGVWKQPPLNDRGAARMKLAQFKSNATDSARLGALVDGHVVDIGSLALEAQKAGGKTSDWLLSTSTTLEVIERGDAAIEELSALLESGKARGLLRDERLSVPVDSVSF